MKIKIKNLQVKSNEINIDLKDADLEISKEEISLLLDTKDTAIKQIVERSLSETFSTVNVNTYYRNHKKLIIPGDIVEILPSEDCVSNTDKIKYNETADGQKASVVRVDAKENIATVEFFRTGIRSDVHCHWLKYITIDEPKNNP